MQFQAGGNRLAKEQIAETIAECKPHGVSEAGELLAWLALCWRAKLGIGRSVGAGKGGRRGVGRRKTWELERRACGDG